MGHTHTEVVRFCAIARSVYRGLPQPNHLISYHLKFFLTKLFLLLWSWAVEFTPWSLLYVFIFLFCFYHIKLIFSRFLFLPYNPNTHLPSIFIILLFLILVSRNIL